VLRNTSHPGLLVNTIKKLEIHGRQCDTCDVVIVRKVHFVVLTLIVECVHVGQ